jgi:hypothetical protein
MDELPGCDNYQFTRPMECELIVDLKGVVAINNDLTKSVRRFRMLDNRKYIAGT